jgi:hypothetical protein
VKRTDDLPDITKLATRVAAAIDDAVGKRFSRRHRFGAGQNLCAASRHVARCCEYAYRAWDNKLDAVEVLSRAIDDLKIEIRIADLVKAWGSFGEMEAVIRLVDELGGKVGGWKKALHSKGQNAAAGSQPQRAQILSSRSASQGANA